MWCVHIFLWCFLSPPPLSLSLFLACIFYTAAVLPSILPSLFTPSGLFLLFCSLISHLLYFFIRLFYFYFTLFLYIQFLVLMQSCTHPFFRLYPISFPLYRSFCWGFKRVDDLRSIPFPVNFPSRRLPFRILCIFGSCMYCHRRFTRLVWRDPVTPYHSVLLYVVLRVSAAPYIGSPSCANNVAYTYYTAKRNQPVLGGFSCKIQRGKKGGDWRGSFF